MNPRSEEMEKLCKPVVEFLRNNYHPHATIVITDSMVKLEETSIGIPFPYEERAASEREKHPVFIPEDSNGPSSEPGYGMISPI